MARTDTQSESTTAPRIAVFTHDTFGLGHVRRSLHIVGAVARRVPDAAILLVTGSPALHAFRQLPANADFVKIPTLVQTGERAARPPHLPLGAREVSSIRKRVIRGTVDSFRPDLFLVDNFPLGSRKELVPTLERLRALSIPAVLGLRDIVDHPDVVRATWTKDGIYDALRDFYERILVYGLPEVLDVPRAYAMPADVGAKVRYCGYVTAPLAAIRPARSALAELGLEPPVVVASVGGGGDGFPLLSAFVGALERTPGVSGVAVTGPLMAAAERSALREMADPLERLAVLEFVPDLPAWFAAADLVVTMGGYNTTAELLALGCPAIVMPRNWRYGEHRRGTRAGVEWEQLLRARAMERRGLVDVLPPESLSAESLAHCITAALTRPRGRRPAPPDLEGVDRVVDEVLSALRARVEHAQV